MGTSKNLFFGDAVLGAGSAGKAAPRRVCGMYALVRERFWQKREHRATTQYAPQNELLEVP